MSAITPSYPWTRLPLRGLKTTLPEVEEKVDLRAEDPMLEEILDEVEAAEEAGVWRSWENYRHAAGGPTGDSWIQPFGIRV